MSICGKPKHNQFSAKYSIFNHKLMTEYIMGGVINVSLTWRKWAHYGANIPTQSYLKANCNIAEPLRAAKYLTFRELFDICMPCNIPH